MAWPRRWGLKLINEYQLRAVGNRQPHRQARFKQIPAGYGAVGSTAVMEAQPIFFRLHQPSKPEDMFPFLRR